MTTTSVYVCILLYPSLYVYANTLLVCFSSFDCVWKSEAPPSVLCILLVLLFSVCLSWLTDAGIHLSNIQWFFFYPLDYYNNLPEWSNICVATTVKCKSITISRVHRIWALPSDVHIDFVFLCVWLAYQLATLKPVTKVNLTLVFPPRSFINIRKMKKTQRC